MDKLLFICALVLFFFTHSLFASTWAKTFIQKKLIPYKYYRVFYNIQSFLFLLPPIIIYLRVDKNALFSSGILSKIIALILILSGFYLWKETFKNYSGSEFLGTDRLYSSKDKKIVLEKGGLNKLVRHPIYTISYLVLSGFLLLFPNEFMLLTILLISIYFPLGIHFEEKKLVHVFGEDYIQYQKLTPMLVPDLKKTIAFLNEYFRDTVSKKEE